MNRPTVAKLFIHSDIMRQSRSLISVNVHMIKRDFVSTSSFNNKKFEEKVVQVLDDNPDQEKEVDIERLRDKSRLLSHDRNILFDKKPYSEPKEDYHRTVLYNRKMYGKYGSESGVNPGVMWPTKADIEERKEYEKVAYPFTIQELIKSATDEQKQRELEIQEAHDCVVTNMAKLEIWKKTLKEKIAKREAEALAVKEKKDKLVEEVRRHFGYTVNIKDERFKEMLAVKEKEQKKLEKKARIEDRERKAIAKLMSKHETTVSESNTSAGNT